MPDIFEEQVPEPPVDLRIFEEVPILALLQEGGFNVRPTRLRTQD